MPAEGEASSARAQWMFLSPGRRSLPWWQPWAALAAFSFGLHYVWETLHAPLYVGLAEMPHAAGVVCCLRATAGDVGITLVAYGAVAAATRDRFWAAAPRRSWVAWYLGAGVAITVVMEVVSVYGWARWTYAPAMPTIAGIGLSPLLQWLMLPPVALWLARRHAASTAFTLHSSHTQLT